MIDLIKDLQAIGLDPIVIDSVEDVAKLPSAEQLAEAASPPPEPSVVDPSKPLNLDDIRKRVMADQPISIEEEKLLCGSIRRAYSMQMTPPPKPRKAAAAPAGEPRRVAERASTGGKKTSSEQFAALGGLAAFFAKK